MEAISLTASVITLATLFNNCVDFFEFLGHAQTFEKDYELLIVKLDVQKERFLTWGELVGVTKNTREEGRHAYLDEKHDWVQKCLHSIERLCSDTAQLESDYGVKPVQQFFNNKDESLSANRINIFRKSYSALKSRSDKLKQSKILQKTRWAISDKEKFEKLIDHLTTLIKDLHDVVPVPQDSQNRLMFADAAKLSVTKLRLLQVACDGEYQSLSAAASGIIAASEAGTVSKSSIGRWSLGANSDMDEEEAEESGAFTHRETHIELPVASDLSHMPLRIHADRSTYLYFVYTYKCLFTGTKAQCSASSIGQVVLGNGIHSFLPAFDRAGGASELGKRIVESMNVQFDIEHIHTLQSISFKLGELQQVILENNLPLGTLYIFCGPCTCALKTALEVCAYQQSKLIKALVRVDDRIDTTCCVPGAQQQRLGSLVHAIKVIESDPDTDKYDSSIRWASFIDRVWIEKRIYSLEEGAYDHGANREGTSRLAELLEDLRPSKSKHTAIVILGELDACQRVMHRPPFPRTPRMPKETEVYQFTPTSDGSSGKWRRDFLGTFTPRDYYLQGDSSEHSTVTRRRNLSSSELHDLLSQTSLDTLLKKD